MNLMTLLAQVQIETPDVTSDVVKEPPPSFNISTIPWLQIVISVSAIAIAILILLLLRRVLRRRISDLGARHKARKTATYITFLVILMVLAMIWIRNLIYLSVVLGFVGAGIAFALQNVILSFVGWMYITFNKAYDLGDRIQVGSVVGDIIDIGMLQTFLLEIGNWVNAEQSTGRIVSIPNSKIITDGVYNYTRGFPFIWNEIPITITFESNWQKAKDIIFKHSQTEDLEKVQEEVKTFLKKMARKFYIYYEHLEPIVYVTIKDSGICITLRYLTKVRQRRMTECRIAEAILHSFAAEPDINFAYPTKRFVVEEPLDLHIHKPPEI